MSHTCFVPPSMDGAFLDNPPETVAARQILLDQLAAMAEQAWAADPRSLTSLDLGDLYCPKHPPHRPYVAQARANPEHEYTHCPPLCTHFTWPAQRPRYDLVADRVTDMTVLRAQVRKSDEAYNSQVYRGTMKSKDGRPVAVVVKIYRTSLSHDVNRFAVEAPKELWKVAFQPFLTEHWAYGRMQPLQGIVVPHVYGFFRVVLPGGEPAIVLITEFIPAVEVPELRPDKLPLEDPQAFHRLTTGLAAAAHAVANCGVYNMDDATSNLIWHGGLVRVEVSAPNDPQGQATLPFPVLIDFALSRELARTGLLRGVLINVLRTMSQYGVRESVICPWWERNRSGGAFLARIFDAAGGELVSVEVVAGVSGWESVRK